MKNYSSKKARKGKAAFRTPRGFAAAKKRESDKMKVRPR